MTRNEFRLVSFSPAKVKAKVKATVGIERVLVLPPMN